jgi:hypothetical protein
MRRRAGCAARSSRRPRSARGAGRSGHQSIPTRCRSCRTGRSRRPGTTRPERSPRSRRCAGFCHGNWPCQVLAISWPPGANSSPQVYTAPSRPPRADGQVSGGVGEEPVVRYRHRRGVDPEAADGRPVHGALFGIEISRAHQECAAGDPGHVAELLLRRGHARAPILATLDRDPRDSCAGQHHLFLVTSLGSCVSDAPGGSSSSSRSPMAGDDTPLFRAEHRQQ